jgi:DNA-binding CsgD family transcriptional regulator/pimeloyl-ACP methyl ester carboxylesterase
MRRWYEGLARRFTLVRFDHRGSGLSSRSKGLSDRSIDALTRDLDAVVGHVPPEPLVLFGWLAGGLPAVAWAARHPERVSHLVLWSSFARDAAHGQAARMRSLFEMASRDWDLFAESISQAALGWTDAPRARQWAAVLRDATSQPEFIASLTARRGWDVTGELSKIQCPTLVLHDRGNALATEERSRELAVGIPGARFLACRSEAGAPDEEALETIRSFVGTGSTVSTSLPALTGREREVLALVASGAGNAEIADHLYISIHTVTRHLTHIYSKIGAKGRADAVRWALEHGVETS